MLAVEGPAGRDQIDQVTAETGIRKASAHIKKQQIEANVGTCGHSSKALSKNIRGRYFYVLEAIN